MKKLNTQQVTSFVALISLAISSTMSIVQAAPNEKSKAVFKHWTTERIKNALPRDLVIDARGNAFLRRTDGSLHPYGNAKGRLLQGEKPSSMAKPVSPGADTSDTTPPNISSMSPSDGDTIGTGSMFSAVVTDDISGVKSVTFVVTYPDGVTTQSFSPSFVGGDVWQITLNGFSNGDWSWHVEAKDNARKGGNTAISNTVSFSVDTSSGGSAGGGTSSYIISNEQWKNGGQIQAAAGRVYFEMPDNKRRNANWSGYVCSGTVATDNTSGRSIIITASHCVYDDANGAFARNVLFIPNQQDTTGNGTDLNCSNDPVGCWAPAFGVVDANWTASVFPDNIAWDYAYYVVDDTGAHSGTASTSESLDVSTGSIDVNFATPMFDDGDPSASSADFTHALGYSYSQDPNFMYCAEDMTTMGSANWWLSSCGLTGGSSGGPWIQPMDSASGNGPLISVNSWGYTTQPGMAGPKLSGNSAACLFDTAKATDFLAVSGSDGKAGVIVDNCN